MFITITFSHDRGGKEHIHKYLVQGDTASGASEAITQLLLSVYAEHGAGVTVTTQQADQQLGHDDAIVKSRQASRTRAKSS